MMGVQLGAWDVLRLAETAAEGPERKDCGNGDQERRAPGKKSRQFGKSMLCRSQANVVAEENIESSAPFGAVGDLGKKSRLGRL
jgi:hypothetical protein